MGGYDYDRQSFMRVAEPEPKSRPAFSIPGSLILLALLVAIGFAAYSLLKAYEGSGASANDADLSRIEHRLDLLEKRMDRLDAKRSVQHAKREAAAARDDSIDVDLRTSSGDARGLASAPLILGPDGVVSASSASRPFAPQPAKPARVSPGANNTARQPVAPGAQEEWEATANRLGDIVGELATERNDIDRTRENIGRLSELLGRNSTPFALRKGAGPQQVGPIRLRLQSTDPKNARYTMRLFLGDDSIELKDRALHEAIQFYASGGTTSFGLVVSEITKNGVAGRLSLPMRASGK